MKHLAGIEISPAQLEQLIAYCHADNSFPKSWESWQKLLGIAANEALAAGLAPHKVTVDVEEFRAWTHRAGIVLCLDALRAYAVAKRNPEEHGQVGGSAPGPGASF